MSCTDPPEHDTTSVQPPPSVHHLHFTFESDNDMEELVEDPTDSAGEHRREPRRRTRHERRGPADSSPRKQLRILSVSGVVFCLLLVIAIIIIGTLQIRGEFHLHVVIILENAPHGEEPIRIRLFDQQAPKTTTAFLQRVRNGAYTMYNSTDAQTFANTSAFYRMQPGVLIQGGRGFWYALEGPDYTEYQIPNRQWTLAQARCPSVEPPSNTINRCASEFFINLIDNTALLGPAQLQPGYTVFGQVVSGTEALLRISQLATYYPPAAGPNTSVRLFSDPVKFASIAIEA